MKFKTLFGMCAGFQVGCVIIGIIGNNMECLSIAIPGLLYAGYMYFTVGDARV